MTPSWRTVCLGLRVVLAGVRVIGWSLACLIAFGCAGLGVLAATHTNDVVGWVVLTLVLLAVGGVIVGRLICTVGRWICVACPPDAPKARARARLAALFETSGLLSLAALLVAARFSAFLPAVFGLIGFAFLLLTTVLGRVGFFWFVRAVAEEVPLPTVLDNAKHLAKISLLTVVLAAVGCVLWYVGSAISTSDSVKVLGIISGVVLLFLGFGFTIYLFGSHLLQVAEVRTALAAYTPPPPDDDPDAAYRERHLAGGGSDADA